MGEQELVHGIIKTDEFGDKRVVRPSLKKKTVYDRAKTMNDRVLDYNIVDRGAILEDFKTLLGALDGPGDKKYTVGSYDYFILRLASRRGIEITPWTSQETRNHKDRTIDKKIEERVRVEYKGLPYNRKRTEEMWDRIREEQRKVHSGEMDAPEVAEVSILPEDIKTYKSRKKLDEAL